MKNHHLHSVRVAVVSLLSLAFWSCGQPQEGVPARDGVFVHISHGAEDAHRFLMGLRMAVTMAEGGQDVLVYCDIGAVKVLVAGAPAVTQEVFPSSDEMLGRLRELNVKVLACPTCMKVAKIEESQLRPGVSAAQRDLFFSFTKGRILSLDY